MISALITLLIYLVVLGVLFWLAKYILNAIPMDEPFKRVANVVLVVIAVLILVILLLKVLGMVGGVSLSLP